MMDARAVKDALLRRHPGTDQFGGPGPWTCLTEWCQIDLIAFAAWSSAKPSRVPHSRVGYEIKVSRSDYKRELKNPGKRAVAVKLCHEFYFAVPFGLLKTEETHWVEPPGFNQLDPFAPLRCPGYYGAFCVSGRVAMGVVDKRTSSERRSPWSRLPTDRWHRLLDASRTHYEECQTCRGAGTVAASPAERAGAPKLWVPADVGLVEIRDDGKVYVVKRAPLNKEPRAIDGRHLTDLVRWASYRPDPRHHQRQAEEMAA